MAQTSVTEPAVFTAPDKQSVNLFTATIKFIRKWPVLPAALALMMLVFALFAPLISPHNPEVGDLLAPETPPFWSDGGSSKYILGTDALGRDILSRTIYGARISLLIAAVVLSTGAIGGTALGIIAGWFGGAIDEVIMRLVDLFLAVPFILVALVVVIVLGQSLTIIILLLAIFSWGGFARQMRAETLQIKTLDYINFSKIAGANNLRIMIRHIFPGVINTLLVLATLRVGQLILTESIMSFLGVGVPPPTPAWGLMVADGRDYLGTAWWMAFFPGMAIFATVFATNFLGDWMRDRFDPRLRQIHE